MTFWDWVSQQPTNAGFALLVVCGTITFVGSVWGEAWGKRGSKKRSDTE